MMGIYKIENLINGKVYIGQSVHIKKRWREHIAILNFPLLQIYKRPLYQSFIKYGLENFSFNIIEQCSKDLLNEREIYWIKYYNSCIYWPNSNGYNLTIGGEGNTKITEQDIEDMITLWEEGKTTTQISKILGYSSVTIKTYLKECCFSYTIEEGKERGKKQPRGGKEVNQYDKEGNFIRKFSSLKEASEINNIDYSTIKRAAKGEIYLAKGNFYIYADENQQEALNKRYNLYKMQIKNNKNYKAVFQIDPITNKIVNQFSSCTEAAETLFYKGARRYIGECCKKPEKIYKGYKWRFVEND